MMNISLPLKRLFPLVAAFLSIAGTSQAQLLLSVDFSAGSTAPGSPATQAGYEYFNLSTAAVTTNTSRTYTGLSTDLSSGNITLTLGTGVAPNYTARDRDTMSGSGVFSYYNLYRAYATPGTLSLSGLNANTQYEIVFYSYDNNNNGTTKLIDRTTGVSGASASVTFTSNYNFTSSTPNSIFSNSLNVTSDSSGNLNFWLTNATGTTASGGVISGFQIYAVPEPSTIALSIAAIAFISLGVRRRTLR